MTMAPRTFPTRRRRLAGLSLIELMVALVVGFLILTAMLTAYVSNSSSSNTSARFSEVQTNGRYAMDFMRREIQHAGFLGLSWTSLSSDSTTATTDALCGSSITITDIAKPLWASNDAKALSCITDANYARGDVLLLRRADLQAASSLVANTAYVRTEFLQGTAFVGTSAPATLQTPSEDYKLKADVYFVSPYTNTVGDGVPALKRATLGVGPAFTTEVVATGIEHMQVQFGVLAAGAVTYLDASSVPASDWANVVAVRLWLLARSSDPEYGGFSNTTSYAFGDRTGTNAYAPNDNYVRQLFSSVIQVRR